jgi:hypothetical protein
LPDSGKASGSLSPAGLDVVDVYHFDVPRLSDVRMDISTGGRSFELVLLSDSGGRIGSAEDRLSRRLNRGRYVVAVRGEVGSRGGRYRLSVLLRDVTSTSVAISSTEVSPGTTISLSAFVSPSPSGGTIELRIERLDPLTGWHFHRLTRVSAPGGSVSWTPPAPGRWRVRATFAGTARSSPSRSGYAQVLVAKPIG